MSRKPIVLLLAIIAITVTKARAEPPPLPPEKMWEYSDAIVVVDVLSTTLTADRDHQDEPIYSVRMRVREVRKGSLSVGHVMVRPMSNFQATPGGSGGGVAYPGQQILYYLKRDANGAYHTWGHNCCETLRDVPPEQRKLPIRVGESVHAQTTACPIGSQTLCSDRLLVGTAMRKLRKSVKSDPLKRFAHRLLCR